jgi:hypothetical protein
VELELTWAACGAGTYMNSLWSWNLHELSVELLKLNELQVELYNLNELSVVLKFTVTEIYSNCIWI